MPISLSRPRFIAYLHNNIFPPLLSAEEEASALARMAEGDEDARSELIEHNLRLVVHIAKKFESSNVDRDDLLSIGTIGLVKGIRTFNPDKGARLATYVARCIENEILMHLRRIRNQRTEVSLYDPVGVDKEGNEVPSHNDQCYGVCVGGSLGGRSGYRVSVNSPLPPGFQRWLLSLQ